MYHSNSLIGDVIKFYRVEAKGKGRKRKRYYTGVIQSDFDGRLLVKTEKGKLFTISPYNIVEFKGEFNE